MSQADIDAAERARREAEEAERRRQARIAELRGYLYNVENSISHYESVLRTLTDARTTMNNLKNRLNSSVDVPAVSYVLHGASDWEGVNAVLGDDAHGQIKAARIGYDADVDKLISDIDNGVDTANSILQSLYNQRNNILNELRSLGA